MIKTFADKSTEQIFSRQFVKGIPSTIIKNAYRKLLMIEAAERLDDLRVPPATGLKNCQEIYPGNTVSE